jgi:hypothetical protein
VLLVLLCGALAACPRKPEKRRLPPPPRMAPRIDAGEIIDAQASAEDHRKQVPEAERASDGDCAAMLVNLLVVDYREHNGGKDPPKEVRDVYTHTIAARSEDAIASCVKFTKAKTVKCLAAAKTNAALHQCEAE